MKRPEYFEKIRSASEKRWEQLEADPELAGPWHQLFKQVQSPRHILSELLQNADDANATEAIVKIENGTFIFEHNGHDFIESHFASICRFGYSNKRALHTIGFRGIGFKSTFSLGDRVYLNSPTLCVAFDSTRFTLPFWTDRKYSQCEKTYVSVEIKSKQIESELLKNLKEWLNSPYSLLFFKNIRALTISGKRVEWKSVGVGPVSNSEWMALDGNLEKPYLVVRSEPQNFPAEALSEIHQERMTGSEEASNEFPPCSIDIVLGAEGRLYVVLPTGVQTELPFACNAPFIQDPARLKIKDPETSPTNQWLLQRAGALAAEAMMAWLSHQNPKGDAKELAYDLMPDINREDSSLEGLCAATVELAFEAAIDKKSIILTSESLLISAGEGFFVPKRLLEIWNDQLTSELFEVSARPLISTEISKQNLQKLSSWNLIESLTSHKLYERLRDSRLPQPRSWKQLLLLWDYLAPDIISYRAGNIADLAIVPVNGQDHMYSSNDVVRLGEKRLVQSEEDWLFLSPYLKVMNSNWTRFITEKKRGVDVQEGQLSEQVENASRVLERLHLQDTDEIGAVLEKVSERFFLEKEIKLTNCIRLAQIHAKLNASVGPSFKYVNEASQFKGIDSKPLRDQSKLLDYLIPEALHEELLLHERYDTDFVSCSKDEWKDWAKSEKSHLSSFVPLAETQAHMYGRKNVRQMIQKRMGPSDLDYPYVTNGFYFKDWDFPEIYWDHWEKRSATDTKIWFTILEQIFTQKTGYWRVGRSAKMLQIATTGSTKPITYLPILPNWIMKFRELKCLPDQYGGLNKPKDLFCRTKATEAFIDTELFIPHEMDSDSNRPLLDLLGVQTTPIDGSKLISRLMAIAGVKDAPRTELEKWYRRIDQFIHHADSEERALIAKTFQTEKVILANDGSWQTSKSIFIHEDEEGIPGAPIVIANLMSLSLWAIVGVSIRPTMESAIEWLESISNGHELTAQDLVRIKNLCAKYPTKIWVDCGKWLNVLGEWVETANLSYCLSMQTLTQTQHLFTDLKAVVADFRFLSMDILNERPFSEILSLRSVVENKLQNDIQNIENNLNLEWLHILGRLMSRIIHPKDSQENLIRNAGVVFSKLVISIVKELRVVPFIGGNPVGTERGVKVFFEKGFFLVNESNEGKRAKLVPNTLGEDLPIDIKDALTYCYRRDPEHILEYMEANFEFVAASGIDENKISSNEINTIDPEQHSEVSQLASTNSDNSDTDIANLEIEMSQIADDEDLPNLEENTIDNVQTSKPVMPTKPSPRQRPRLIDRYALLAKFDKFADGSYRHSDGQRMVATQNRIFPFELRSADGELLKYYLPREHCLELEPLEINAENWQVIEDKPELYSLILTDLSGKPIVLSGEKLLELRKKGTLKIFTAKYRLSYS